jgi:hypothetical protein
MNGNAMQEETTMLRTKPPAIAAAALTPRASRAA